MEIKTGKTAYYFPYVWNLKKFIKLHQNELVGQEELLQHYKLYGMRCFNFYSHRNGVFTWACNDMEEYIDYGYTFITIMDNMESDGRARI